MLFSISHNIVLILKDGEDITKEIQGKIEMLGGCKIENGTLIVLKDKSFAVYDAEKKELCFSNGDYIDIGDNDILSIYDIQAME